jgi:hypothetical protein
LQQQLRSCCEFLQLTMCVFMLTRLQPCPCLQVFFLLSSILQILQLW